MTRTQVGRDGLKAQIQRSFANQFTGTLEIGDLRGDLVYRLFADDVQVFDSTGHNVATIDRLVVSPSWTELFRRRLQFSSVHADGIHFYASSDSTGQWDILNVFSRDNVAVQRDPFEFRVAEVELENLELLTQSAEPALTLIEDGRMFDLGNSEMQFASIRGAIDWTVSSRIIDLYHFDGFVNGTGITIDDIRGQVVVEPEQLSVNDLFVRSGDMSATLAGFIQTARPDTAIGFKIAAVELDVEFDRIDNERILEVLPRWKLRSSFSTSFSISGPSSDLRFSEARFSTGRSFVEFDGSIKGLPDSVVVEGILGSPGLFVTDVDAFAPSVDIRRHTHIDSLSFTSPINGSVNIVDRSFKTRFSDLLLQTNAGYAAGTIEYASSGARDLTGALSIADLNPGIVVGKDIYDAEINGQMEFRLQQRDDGPAFELVADLSRSRIREFQLDSTVVNGFFANDLFSGDVRIRQDGGTLIGGVSVDMAPERPTFEANFVASQLDAGTMNAELSRFANVNAQILLEGQGRSRDNIRATLEVVSDSSTIVSGAGTTNFLDTRLTRISLFSGNDRSSLELSGDLVEGVISANQNLAALIDHREHWGQIVNDRINQLLMLREDRGSGDVVSTRYSVPDLPVAQVEGSITMYRVTPLQAILPQVSVDGSGINLEIDAEISPDQFVGSLEIKGDSLQIGSTRMDSLNSSLSISALIAADSTSVIDFVSTFSGAHGSINRQRLAQPRLAIVMTDRVGSLTFNSTNPDGVTPVDISARVSNSDNGTTLLIDRLSVESSRYRLALSGERRVGVFRDAVIVDNVEVGRQQADILTTEFVRLDGILSRAPEDTLRLESSNLSLADLSEVFSFRKTIGGQLDANLSFSNGDNTPAILGEMRINTLSIDDRILGDARATSTFNARANEIAINASITPSTPTAQSALINTNNALTLDGVIRKDPGAASRLVDLNIEIDRADLFFFEYIFSSTIADVSGYTSGRGTVSGSLNRPLFDARLDIIDGDFRVPRFNLHYNIEGVVELDDRGIHIIASEITDQQTGSALLEGSVLFNDYSFFSLALNGSLSELQIIDIADSDELPFFGHIRASGEATLTGPISGALLTSNDAVTTPESEIFIPLVEVTTASDASFIVFTDSAGVIPDLTQRNRRKNVLARRPVGERSFIDGLDMNLNIQAPQGSTVHLVIDPLVGDVINAVGSARVQLQRTGGVFATYGTFLATGGDYLFTAGEVFVRRFDLDSGGVITWDGDPTNAQLNIPASYRTRASRAGLPSANQDTNQSLIPLVVRLNITGRVATPEVNLSLEVDRSDRNISTSYDSIEAILNQPERATEYATSVLLTNSFLLTTQGTNTEALTTSAFNSLSQLVASQLNRYINEALPNIDFSFGIQGDNAQELDVTYGIALRLLDERLVIRGQGVYQGARSDIDASQQSLQGEFVVEVRLNPSVSVEMFYRREGDVLAEESFLTNTTGAGLSYQTEFSTWRRFFRKLFGNRDNDAGSTDDSDSTTARRYSPTN